MEVCLGGDPIVAINGIPVTQAQDVVRIVSQMLVPGEQAASRSGAATSDESCG